MGRSGRGDACVQQFYSPALGGKGFGEQARRTGPTVRRGHGRS